MGANILDGKELAQTIRTEIQDEAAAWRDANGHAPTLAMFRVGSDSALLSHARSVRRSFEKVDFGFREVELPADSDMTTVLDRFRTLNDDERVHGILIQEPLPDQVDQTALLDILDPRKDVDGVHPLNAGRLMQQRGQYHVSSTPLGGMELLDHYDVTLKGTLAVVVGRSDIVGKPMGLLLLHRHATVVTCHSRTIDLGSITRQADILCAAVGRAGLITADMVKPGATVVDFGINFVDGSLVGDVDFDGVQDVAGAITPVPGGTGPVTSAVLLRNTLQAAQWLGGTTAR